MRRNKEGICHICGRRARLTYEHVPPRAAFNSNKALIFSFVSYVIGNLSDRFGRRLFVILSQVIIVAAGIGLIFGNKFTTLLFFYGLFCVGETITYLLSFVYASGTFDKKYIGTSMAAFDAMMNLSLFIGPLLAISIYRHTSEIAPIFIIAVIPAVLAFFATAVWLPQRVKRKG